jgi:predicted RNA binding protein YcfA (HicA-like mRNA interferase family)
MRANANAKPEPIRARDVEKVILKLGFRQYSKKTKLFFHDEDSLTTSLPDDPDWVIADRHLEFILRDIRLTERKFRELLKAS